MASPKRAPAPAERPTLAEAGVPGVEADAWFALFAPAKTPDDNRKALRRGLRRAPDRGCIEAVAAQGMTLAHRSPSGTRSLAARRNRQMGGGDQGRRRRRGVNSGRRSIEPIRHRPIIPLFQGGNNVQNNCGHRILGLLGSAAPSQAQQLPAAANQTANIKRTPLQKFDVPGTNLETVIGIAEIVPNVLIGRHTHRASKAAISWRAN